VIESTYAASAHGAFDSRSGYRELAALAELLGKLDPECFVIAVRNISASPHADMLRAHLLLRLAKGMSSEAAIHP
jgi:hypothetical protein